MLFIATNRRARAGGFGGTIQPRGELTYLSGDRLESRGAGPFRRRLLAALSQETPDPSQGSFAVPRVIGCFHGYNNGFEDSLRWARLVADKLTSQLQGAAVTVGFSWPSEGKVAHYLDDRHMAEESAPAVTRALGDAFRLLEQERCSAELCLVAHSMGCYVLARAAQRAWELRGHPRSMPIFSEIILAGADLDANALEPGKVGEALPVFARRLHVYWSRHDRALLASSAKRAGVTGARLGRSGPARPDRLPANVVSVDVSPWTRQVEGVSPHSAHFHEPVILRDMLAVLAGQDRAEIEGRESIGSPLSSSHAYRIPWQDTDE